MDSFTIDPTAILQPGSMMDIFRKMIGVTLENYRVVALVLTIFVVIAAYQLREPNRVPDDLPWVGGFTTPFAKMLAPYRSVFRGHEFLDEAYNKFGKHDRICVMPSIFENRVTLPMSYMDWVIRQPSQDLSGVETTAEDIMAEYTARAKPAERKPVFEEFVHRQFKLHLEELTPVLMDEIRFAMDDLLGLDTNRYKTIKIRSTMKRILTRTAFRVFMGPPLCRDAEFLENVNRYLDSIVPVGFLIRLMPTRVGSTVGRTLALINRFFYLKYFRSVSPIISERMKQWHAASDVKLNDLPNTWLSWSVDEVMRRDTHKTADKKLRWVARRLINLSFAATQTVSHSTTNFILDIFSTQNCANDLLMESETLNTKYGSNWNRARISEMTIMDSSFRESLRKSPLATVSNKRRVLASGGLTLPNGTWLPCGTLIDMSCHSMHQDESIYPGALEFRYTRFMESSKEGTSATRVTTTDPTFLSWGHGKHACPGRFFAADMIKMAITYLITNYEVIPLSERPKNRWFMDYTIPPLDATLQVRRRVGTVEQ